MQTIAGGSRKTPPPRKKPQDERLVERAERKVRIRDAETPTKGPLIKVEKTELMNLIVPGSVWRTQGFRYQPQTFVPESDKLNNRFIEPSTQLEGLQLFLDDPTQEMIYAITGNPDDYKAKYFAAYLVQHHLRQLGSKANVVWTTLYGYGDTTLRDSFNPDKSRPTLLVVSNITAGSTPRRMEDARDLLERYSRIPRLVVGAGEDPLSFMTTRLYMPVHALAYFSGPLIKRQMEVM